MNVLALDTSTLACTVALAADGNVCSRHAVEPREHTRLLVPMIRDVLAEAGIDATALEAIVLGNGPGSFIGMRIAASVAQGLCFATGAALVPVSSLAAVAAEVLTGTDDPCCIAVTQDAHMNEVYLALFDAGSGNLPLERTETQLHAVRPIADLPTGAIAAGAGWNRYPELLEANRDRLAGLPAVLYPHGTELLRLGIAALERGEVVAPADLTPAYVREQVARPPRLAGC